MREGPLSHFPGPNQKCKEAKGDFEESPFADGAGMPEKPGPGEHGEDSGQWIKPHFEGQAFRGPAPVEKNDADSLADKLNEEAHGENGGDSGFEFEGEAEDKGEAAEEKQ